MLKDGWQAVVAGVGGQGVLFVTKMLAAAVAGEDGRVLISEVHGMAQRGGSVLSHLKVGGFAGPLVARGRADLLLSLDPGEAVRNLSFLAPGAALAVDAGDDSFLSPEARRGLSRRKVKALFTDASETARRAGDPRGANLALLAAAAAGGLLPVGPAQLKRALLATLPPARREAALRVLEAAGGGPGPRTS